MRLVISRDELRPRTAGTVEVVEVKGVGHPDTMADAVAEDFSRRYSIYANQVLGVVPNHWVDKVVLAGAEAVVRLGEYRIDRDITAILLGKVTPSVGSVRLPVEELFRESVAEVLRTSTRSEDIVKHVKTVMNCVSGSAVDHDPNFYTPVSSEKVQDILKLERVANDSVVCCSFAGDTPVEALVRKLISYLTSPEISSEIPGCGTDVKILAMRTEGHLRLVACMPIHPESVGSWDEYARKISAAKVAATEFASGLIDRTAIKQWELLLNTRDTDNSGYLAPFGTSLGKGDVGVVGRGNRIYGLIAPGRLNSGEAPAGKNPMSHGGKVYSILCQRIASLISEAVGTSVEVLIASEAGRELDDPNLLWIDVQGGVGWSKEQVANVVEKELSSIGLMSLATLDGSWLGDEREFTPLPSRSVPWRG